MSTHLHGNFVCFYNQADLVINNGAQYDNSNIELIAGQICNLAQLIHRVNIDLADNNMELADFLNPNEKLLCICLITELSKASQLLLHGSSFIDELVHLNDKIL